MANWIGTGVPVLSVDGTEYTMPLPRKGSRDERWEPEVDEVWTNQVGKRLYGDRKFRFLAEYTWSQMTNNQIQLLIQWYNQKQEMTLQPYSDTQVHKVQVRIEGLDLPRGAVNTAQSVVTARFESVILYESIPTPDLTIAGYQMNRVGVVV